MTPRFPRILLGALLVALLAPASVIAQQNTGRGHPEQARQRGPKNDPPGAKKPRKPAAGAPDQEHRQVGTSTRIRFLGVDRNHDGVITRTEWRGDDRSFANQDWNHDGVLSGDELRPGAKRPGQAASALPRPGRPATERDEVLFARADTNHDGVLTRTEWRGSAATFARLDFNHDGVLSPYEFGVGR